MPIKPLIMPQPNDKQLIAFHSHKRYVGYGGARGGGKSWFVQWKAILFALKYPGIKILITRRTYPELINNHINPLKAILHGIAKYNQQEKVFKFPNGSTIKFGYCATDSDADQYQGAEYDIWFADEAGQMRQEWLTKINACIRGTNGYPKRTYYTLNPGGVSHAYFKRLFVDKRYEEGEDPNDYEFVQALCTDNKALMESQPDYLKGLETLPPKIKEAWLYGRWDIFEGQFFEELRLSPDPDLCRAAGISLDDALARHQYTHVIRPFDIPNGWQIYRSYDFGYAKPFSCAWWAVDYDGTLYRIMELYGCTKVPNEGVKWSPERQFEEIAKIESTHPWLRGRNILGVADPAIWDASHGISIAEVASQYRVYFQPGDHQRIPGWMQVHYRLQFDDNGRSRMYIFDNCKGFIRTMPMMMYDDIKVEDLDTSLEDHIADEVRYMCMARPIKPVRPADTPQILCDPLNQYNNRRII